MPRGGITLCELRDFFVENGINPDPYELDLLFVHLDFDQDGILNWYEFLDTILSREHHSKYQYGILGDFSMELDSYHILVIYI